MVDGLAGVSGRLKRSTKTQLARDQDTRRPAHENQVIGRVAADVADRLIIWRGMASSDKCVISAHGMRLGTNTFNVPEGAQLIFYGPDGASLDDPGLTAIISNNPVRPYATVTGPCQDYSLAKYQGRHGSTVETYDAIALLVWSILGEGTHASHDVVTIRNRGGTTSLSEVVRILLGYHNYREIHCSFCRE